MKLDVLDLSAEVPVVELMAVVVAKNSAMIKRTDARIDIGQAVLDHLPVLEPDLLFKHRAFSLA